MAKLIPYGSVPISVRRAWDALVTSAAALVVAERLEGRSVFRGPLSDHHSRNVARYRSALRAAGYRVPNLRPPHLEVRGMGLADQVTSLVV